MATDWTIHCHNDAFPASKEDLSQHWWLFHSVFASSLPLLSSFFHERLNLPNEFHTTHTSPNEHFILTSGWHIFKMIWHLKHISNPFEEQLKIWKRETFLPVKRHMPHLRDDLNKRLLEMIWKIKRWFLGIERFSNFVKWQIAKDAGSHFQKSPLV